MKKWLLLAMEPLADCFCKGKVKMNYLFKNLITKEEKMVKLSNIKTEIENA